MTSEDTSPLEQAARLRQAAEELIYEGGLDPILQSFGTVWYTGSYELDLMAWSDLDIMTVRPVDPLSLDAFFDLGRRIADLDGVGEMTFENTVAVPQEELPPGLFWGIWMDSGPLGRRWKIDLWATEQEVYDSNRQVMREIQGRLTDETRKRILDVKRAILTPEGKTPVLSGYEVYQAVLFERLTKMDDILAYLREKGVRDV